MSATPVGGTVVLKEDKLPGRDWMLIPSIAVLTIVGLGASTELLTRKAYTAFDSGEDKCQLFRDPYIGVDRPANCDFQSKLYESEPLELRYNSRGYREDADVTPKQSGVYRIVMVGTSFSVSEGTPKEAILATRLPLELSKLTGKKVELYNEGIAGYPGLPQNVDRRFADVLAAQPDLILWTLTRWDILEIDRTAPEVNPPPGQMVRPEVGENWRRFKRSVSKHALRGAVTSLVKLAYQLVGTGKDDVLSSRSAMWIKHTLLSSESQLVNSYMKEPDRAGGFLKTDLSPEWQERLAHFDPIAAEVIGKARAANIPLVAVMLPNPAQSAMASMVDMPAEWDAFVLDRDVRSIITAHGGAYADIMQDYRDTGDPAHGYYPVDGHPNAEGNERFTRFVSDALLSGAAPSLTDGTKQPTNERER